MHGLFCSTVAVLSDALLDATSVVVAVVVVYWCTICRVMSVSCQLYVDGTGQHPSRDMVCRQSAVSAYIIRTLPGLFIVQ